MREQVLPSLVCLRERAESLPKAPEKILGLSFFVCFFKSPPKHIREGAREKERGERNLISCLPCVLPLGMESATQVGALTRNQTRNLSMPRTTLNQLSYPARLELRLLAVYPIQEIICLLNFTPGPKLLSFDIFSHSWGVEEGAG